MLKLGKLGLMIKPTHGCNMNCSYCYDRIERERVNETMPLELVEEIAKKANDSAKAITWIWHGGEPLLMGKDWILEASDIIRKHIEHVTISIQTNGLLLDEETAKQFTQNNIGVGISFDGVTHDTTRRDSATVMQNAIAASLLHSGTGLITVIDEVSINHIEETYELLKMNGIQHANFNMVFRARPGDDPLYVSLKEYIEKWTKFFDLWFHDKNGISERTCLDFINVILGTGSIVCRYSDCIGMWLSVNPIGEIFPCDRYFPEGYKLGRVSDYMSFVDTFYHDNYVKLKREVADQRIYCLEHCELSEFCKGGCVATTINRFGTAAKVDDEQCIIFKALFTHVFDRIKDLTPEEIKELNPIAKKALVDNGYRSLSTIKQIIREKREE